MLSLVYDRWPGLFYFRSVPEGNVSIDADYLARRHDNKNAIFIDPV